MRCGNCNERVVGFLEFGDRDLFRALFHRKCPRCGARIRPSFGMISGVVAVAATAHFGLHIGMKLCNRWGIVDDGDRLIVAALVATPIMLPLAYAVWRTGRFVATDRHEEASK